MAILAYNYVYQGHRNIQTEVSQYSVSATALLKAFQNDPVGAHQTYLNKTLEISGVITEKSATDLTLDQVVFCSLFEPDNGTHQIQESIIIKGRCIGYDDLLEIVKFDQCHITN